MAHNQLKYSWQSLTARPEQFARQIRNKLSIYVIPLTQDNFPLALNFLAAKGPDGTDESGH
jgi:hypothetical protein